MWSVPKNVLLAAVVAASCTSIAGEPAPATNPALSRNEIMDLCQSLSGFATKVMKARQAGVPVADVMALDVVRSAGSGKIAEQIVLLAYESPLVPNPRVREVVETEFGNKWHTECIRSAPK